MVSFYLKCLLSVGLVIFSSAAVLYGQEKNDSVLVNYDIGEVVVFEDYPFKNHKEEKQFQQLKEDLQVVYPLILIVRSEYKRVNQELSLYQGDKEKEFLKWYENYAKENYMKMLSSLNVRQGRLFLLLISRELEHTPYDLIEDYRNKFRAIMWQGVARVFLSNLKSEYNKDENPMIEYLMKKMDASNGVQNY